MLERKRTRTKKPTAPDAVALLTEADAALSARRQHLATLRQRRAEVLAEHGTITEQIRAEQFTAGREGRDAKGIADRRDQLAELERDATDLASQAEGAQMGVRDAEQARKRVLLEHYPTFAQRLDEAEQDLLKRRAEIEGMVAAQVAAEDQHRAKWDELLRATPVTPDGVSFLPRDAIGVQHRAGEAPAPLLHPYARPDQPGDRLLVGHDLDPSWPAWLKTTWRGTVHPTTDDVRMAVTPAGFDHDPAA